MSQAPLNIDHWRARHPEAFGPALWVRSLRWVILLLGVSYLTYLGRKLGLLHPDFITGLSGTGTILSAMWPPGPESAESLKYIFLRMGETVAMALIGTFIGSLIAIPLGFIGARTVVGNPSIHFIFRRFLDLFRGIPALIWALIFVRAVGLGPMTGILAFIAADFAALSKLYAEAIENADDKQVESISASGASRFFVVRFGLFPQIFPVMLSQALYFFEANVRSAAILGIVGAGGIGGMLDEAIRFNLWGEVAFIILLFLVIVSFIDMGSRWLRVRLIG